MSSLLHKVLSHLPGTKAWQKRKKLQELRVLLKSQGQDVSNLDDDQLEYVAMEVRRQMKETAAPQSETVQSDASNKTLH